MEMFDVGTVCMKIAGRDAGRVCVIVDILDKNMVLIDGDVRRKRCNIMHLEESAKKAEIGKGASHDEVKAAFEKLGYVIWQTKPKQPGQKPTKQMGKNKAKAEAKPAKPKK